MLSRRALLHGTALAAASGMLPLPGLRRLAFAAEPGPRRILIVLHLRGGCDGLNLLSPAGDPDFTAARSSELRVLAEGPDAGRLVAHAECPQVEFRLHHAAGALADLADAKQLAFIHAAGLTDTTRSHFVATDMIEHGVADGATLNRIPSGWLARALQTEPAPGRGLVRAVSTAGSPSGAWAGDLGAISVADLANGLSPPGGAQTGKVLERLYGLSATAVTPVAGRSVDAPSAGHRLAPGAAATSAAAMTPVHGAAPTATAADAVRSAGRIALDSMTAIDGRLPRDARGKYVLYTPEPGISYDAAYELGRPLKTLAQLIKMDLGLEAATVDLGGWDTHEYQPGRFKNQVEHLSQGLGAFYNDMARYQDRLVLVVVTEFGRRLRSNRSNGTDHGRGSVMMVMGGRVAGGKIYGRWPGLKPEQLEEGVDLAVANDYRQGLCEVLGFWSGGRAPAIFPGFSAGAPLGLFV